MKTLSRFKSVLPSLALTTTLLPFIASAQVDNVSSIARNILNLSYILVTIVFVLSIVVFGWGIVRFIFAAGDQAAVTKAKGHIYWGVIGIGVGASIYGLILFLQTYFGVSSGQLKIFQPIVI